MEELSHEKLLCNEKILCNKTLVLSIWDYCSVLTNFRAAQQKTEIKALQKVYDKNEGNPNFRLLWID